MPQGVNLDVRIPAEFSQALTKLAASLDALGHSIGWGLAVLGILLLVAAFVNGKK
jgi:hypothetical protein